MKFVFVHQNFPGQFVHIVKRLASSGRHDIVFISEMNENHIPGVRKVPYMKPEPPDTRTHIAARELDIGVRRAEVVSRTAATLKALGYTPDAIIGHHGWGEMLNLCDVWPKVPMLGYLEFYYHPDKHDVGWDPEFPAHVLDFPRIRAKNAINHIALNLDGHGQTPTRWQLSTYPDWAKPRINLIWEGVDLDVCKPDPKARRHPFDIGGMRVSPSDRLVTYMARDLEPYRGFHTMMRTLPHLLKARKDLKVVMVGGDGVSYGNAPAGGGTWRQEMLKEVGGQLDLERVVFPGRIPYQTYLAMMQRSDAHVYLTYPFVASWSLREAMALGCAIIGSDNDTVREFITDGKNGLLAPFFDPPALARGILNLLEDKDLDRTLRANARRYAEASLSMDDYLGSYEALIGKLVGAPLSDVAAREKTAGKPGKTPPRKTRR